jgi:hypothetical protein
MFERKVENFMRCLNAIERTVPKTVNNIILPTILVNNLGRNVFDKKRKYYFKDVNEFLKDVVDRFKIASLEFKVNFVDEDVCEEKNEKIENLRKLENFEEKIQIFENNEKNLQKNEKIAKKEKFEFYVKNEENFDTDLQIKFISTFIEENYSLLKTLTYSYISFNFNHNNSTNNKKLLNEFRKLLFRKNLTNMTLADHINYTHKNPLTELNDTFDFYDYIYYDKTYADKIWSFILTLKYSKKYSILYKKKFILDNILRAVFKYKYIYNKGRLNFSNEIVKNKKIVPFEFAQNNVVVFTNS